MFEKLLLDASIFKKVGPALAAAFHAKRNPSFALCADKNFEFRTAKNLTQALMNKDNKKMNLSRLEKVKLTLTFN